MFLSFFSNRLLTLLEKVIKLELFWKKLETNLIIFYFLFYFKIHFLKIIVRIKKIKVYVLFGFSSKTCLVVKFSPTLNCLTF